MAAGLVSGRSRSLAWGNRWAGVAVLAAALGLYGPSVRLGFVHADDVDLIAGNAAFLSDPANLPRVFARSYFETAAVTTDVETYYRPLVIASFMADTVIGGGAAGFFHATNAMLHALAAVLALALLRRLGAGPTPAFAAALVFAVHPLNAHAVYWIPGRNELLLAVCVLAAWLAWLRAAATDRPRWLAAHGAAWLLALLSKETATVFPLVWALHAWQARRWRDLVRLPLLATWLVACLVWLGLRTHALGWEASGDAIGAFAAAVWNNLPGMVATIGKVVLPVRLNVTPGADWHGVAVGVAAMALLGAVFARCLPLRTQAFVWGWCLLAFLPGLGVKGLPAYEHRAYVPLLALACGAALALDRLAAGLAAAPAVRPPSGGRRGEQGAAAGRLNPSDPGAPRRGDRAASPDERAGRAREPTGGTGTLPAALRLDTGLPPAHETTSRAGASGVRAAQAGEGTGPRLGHREPEAAAAAVPGRRGASGASGGRPFRRGLQAWMRTRAAAIGLVSVVCTALGAATAARGPVYADPFSFWTDGARDPQFGAMARVNLGQLFESIDRLEEAERQYRLALALDPLVPKAHNNLGVVLMALGRGTEAAAMFERERTLHPGNADAHYNLGLVRAGEGKLDQAIELWERAIATNRVYLPAYEALARAYRTKGLSDRAAAFDEQAAALRLRAGGR
jgi:hypothetical protein